MVIKRPILTSAVAYGPTTGQALAAGAAGVTYTSWIFTATAPDGTKVSVTSLIPDARWGTIPSTALKPSTTCEPEGSACMWAGRLLGVGMLLSGPPRVHAPVGGARTVNRCSPLSLLPAPADIVSVVGVQADGQAVAGENTLPMTTPAAG